MDLMKTGKLIAAARKEAGLTQAELAERLQVTDKSVSKWECGRCMPDAALMRPLCDALHMTIGELFLGERQEAGSEKQAAEASLLELAALYEKIKSYKHVLLGLFIIFLGFLLPTAPSGDGASDFLRFLDGMMLGLSVGAKLLGIVWTLYGFAKASQKG